VLLDGTDSNSDNEDNDDDDDGDRKERMLFFSKEKSRSEFQNVFSLPPLTTNCCVTRGESVTSFPLDFIHSHSLLSFRWMAKI